MTGALGPGVYRRSGSAQVTQTLTLDARGDASAVFVLAATTLDIGQGARIVLQRGASPDRAFFCSATTMRLDESSTSRGVFIAAGDVTLDLGRPGHLAQRRRGADARDHHRGVTSRAGPPRRVPGGASLLAAECLP
ncbi:ice-binding family protein [Georgenia sp. MJ206]|uniref:ice-binding family protein n=1 Tax=Georgenia wangjunii TaxID=3117730 RepID=UPI002F262C87